MYFQSALTLLCPALHHTHSEDSEKGSEMPNLRQTAAAPQVHGEPDPELPQACLVEELTAVLSLLMSLYVA